jgi:hypothetical protein
MPAPPVTEDAADGSADRRADDCSVDPLAAQLALAVARRLGVGGYGGRRFARLLDGPVVALVAIATRLLERLTALPLNLERAQVLDGCGGQARDDQQCAEGGLT